MNHWILVGGLDEIPRLGARRMCTSSGPIAIFRTSDDEIYALADRCPHKAGPLSEGIVSGKTVTCPLHAWTISLETGHACGPDEGATRTIPVKVDDGLVFVALIAEPA